MALMWGIDRSGVGHGSTGITAEGSVAGGDWSNADAKVAVSSKDPTWGAQDAPVTIVIYSDYQCPYCSRVEGTLNALKEKYTAKKLRMVFKHFPLPFHKQAGPAHAASDVVFQIGGNNAFWKFHDVAFANGKGLTPENFTKWAVEAGVDKAKFEAAMKANKGQAKVDKDIADGKAVGVKGTPAFFINGKFISGARPQNAFETEIDAQLKEAEALIAAGTPKAQIYTKLTNKNFKEQPGAAKGKEGKKPPPEDTTTVWKVPLTGKEPIKGNKDALVTIVEFSEFQCPFCSKVLPTLKQIFDTYKDQVRVVFLDQPLPFHKRAMPASNFAHEARAQKGDKAFYEAHDLLFANQKALEDNDLWGYAGKLGLDVEKVKAAVASNKFAALIEHNQELAGDVQASGTPHFFVNGRRLKGAVPFSKFKPIIDEEIIKAKKLLASGTKPANLYAELIKKGKAPPPPEKKDAGEIPKNAPFKGPANAKVVIHEFSDFQCPFCGRVNDSLKQVQKEFGDQVKIVWRHKPLPFHKEAPLAHQAAQEAFAQQGNKGFWAMHDKLFANQKALKRENLDAYAAEIGLDMGKFKAALDGETHKAFVEKETAFSDKLGVRGTPGFVINGYYLSGAQPYAKFKALIKLALKEAK
jgi:protein-disulfide isomerase